MNKPIRIAFVGLGGVGGYYGGLMANHYENNPSVEIIFIARGAHLEAIQKHGLQIIHGENIFTTRPHLATDDPSKIGVLDYLIICTKSYDLTDTMHAFKKNLQPSTIVLPLLNGVNHSDVIKEILPEILTLKGCTYIVSQINRPGVVENNGAIQALYFGTNYALDLANHKRLIQLEHFMKESGIDAHLSEEIDLISWEKFMLVSPTATASAWYNLSFGALMESHAELVEKLMGEILLIAQSKGIPLTSLSVEKTMHKLNTFPYEATTSMHRDFNNNPLKTEIESLTEYIVKEGKKLNIPTPAYEKLHNLLILKSKAHLS